MITKYVDYINYEKNKSIKPLKEDYVRFNFGVLSNAAEGVILDNDLDNITPSCSNQPQYININKLVKMNNYLNNYENTFAKSNTLQMFSGVFVGNRNGNYISLNNNLKNRDNIFGIVLGAYSELTLYVDNTADFRLFKIYGILSQTEFKIPIISNNDNPIYNITGQDINQTFILDSFMYIITLSFLGNILTIQNKSANRYYGALYITNDESVIYECDTSQAKASLPSNILLTQN